MYVHIVCKKRKKTKTTNRKTLENKDHSVNKTVTTNHHNKT